MWGCCSSNRISFPPTQPLSSCDGPRYRETCERQTDTETDRHTERGTDRDTHTHTHTHTQKEKERDSAGSKFDDFCYFFVSFSHKERERDTHTERTQGVLFPDALKKQNKLKIKKQSKQKKSNNNNTNTHTTTANANSNTAYYYTYVGGLITRCTCCCSFVLCLVCSFVRVVFGLFIRVVFGLFIRSCCVSTVVSGGHQPHTSGHLIIM